MHEVVGQMVTQVCISNSSLWSLRRQPAWPGIATTAVLGFPALHKEAHSTAVSNAHVGSLMEPDSHQRLTALILSLSQGQPNLAYFQVRCG